MRGSWKGRGNQYIQLVKVLYCKLPTNGKQLPAFPLEAGPGIEPRSQRWEARVLPVCHHGPSAFIQVMQKAVLYMQGHQLMTLMQHKRDEAVLKTLLS